MDENVLVKNSAISRRRAPEFASTLDVASIPERENPRKLF